MARRAVVIHLVCRNNLGVVEDLETGRFQTRAWKIAARHASTIRSLALHQRKSEESYRQGRVVKCCPDPKEPGRFVFEVTTVPGPVPWRGKGAGEKGYVWED